MNNNVEFDSITMDIEQGRGAGDTTIHYYNHVSGDTLDLTTQDEPGTRSWFLMAAKIGRLIDALTGIKSRLEKMT